MATKTANKSSKKPTKLKSGKASPARTKPAARSGARKPPSSGGKAGAKRPAGKSAGQKPKLRPGAAPKPKPRAASKPAMKPPAKPAVGKAVKPAQTEKSDKLRGRDSSRNERPPKAGAQSPAALKGRQPKAGLQAGAKDGKPAPPKKKLFVGQKPRSPKPSEAIIPSTIIAQQKALPAVNSSTAKASPASVEAKQTFKVHDHIVYPAHGVGRIVAIEKQVIAGIPNELFLIEFEQEKMKLRVPTAKAKAVGMRGLSEGPLVRKAIETLKGRARIKRTMWSRRAQEYEAKINSGDIIQVAEVVRDLFRATDQPEQSYSERQLFEAALDRLAREVAAVHKSDLAKAIGELEAALAAKRAAA